MVIRSDLITVIATLPSPPLVISILSFFPISLTKSRIERFSFASATTCSGVGVVRSVDWFISSDSDKGILWAEQCCSLNGYTSNIRSSYSFPFFLCFTFHFCHTFHILFHPANVGHHGTVTDIFPNKAFRRTADFYYFLGESIHVSSLVRG